MYVQCYYYCKNGNTQSSIIYCFVCTCSYISIFFFFQIYYYYYKIINFVQLLPDMKEG